MSHCQTLCQLVRGFQPPHILPFSTDLAVHPYRTTGLQGSHPQHSCLGCSEFLNWTCHLRFILIARWISVMLPETTVVTHFMLLRPPLRVDLTTLVGV